jgi:hypothetical protein
MINCINIPTQWQVQVSWNKFNFHAIEAWVITYMRVAVLCITGNTCLFGFVSSSLSVECGIKNQYKRQFNKFYTMSIVL